VSWGVAPPLAQRRGGVAATNPVARDAAPWWHASMAQQQVVGRAGKRDGWTSMSDVDGDGRGVDFRQRNVKRAMDASFGCGCCGGVDGAARCACAARVVAPGESLVAAASSDVALPVGGAIRELHPSCARSLGENLVLTSDGGATGVIPSLEASLCCGDSGHLPRLLRPL
jgi:hypothetical protein